ncbi:Quinone oxidoreductase [Candidatus Terasakiella magnetica]|uniref:Quinone oxidoreductase n=1 Tax=Candidatus Terasakiella magnetica TaxID=1867952 RepID=A0A1C3RGC4_9PROT|nr:quinone oxidoreductase [Candidatus Terasakiella magnetica]SCA56353.1 Quinone oxidoreductase [Candidatus Terasakiella magnetica]
MTNAIRIHTPGGPDALTYDKIDISAPSENQVQIRFKAVGLNFIDCYHRSGLYPTPSLPHTIGMEGAGVVEAVGANVSEFNVGQRVCIGAALGCYTELGNFDQSVVIALPDEIEFETAAAMMLKGMTAHYLLRRIYKITKDDTILFHAAAGGVGSIATQWAKSIGTRVIGTVGSPEKAELAKAQGCDHPILYREENFTDKVRELTNGEGVPVVYDSIGGATFEGSLDSLAPLGMMVTYGNATGPVPDFSPALLAQKGSLFITRPSLMHYVAKREDLLWAANDLFDVVKSGAVKIHVNQKYDLKDAEQAHRDLEDRKTTGSTILIP